MWSEEQALVGGDETVLLVEDNESVRRTMETMLESLGYTVMLAESGPEALQLLSEFEGRLDLLLSDVVLPEMGGREVAERVSQARPGVKVLFTTGYTDDVVLQRQLIDGDAELIRKPIDYRELSLKVRAVLDE